MQSCNNSKPLPQPSERLHASQPDLHASQPDLKEHVKGYTPQALLGVYLKAPCIQIMLKYPDQGMSPADCHITRVQMSCVYCATTAGALHTQKSWWENPGRPAGLPSCTFLLWLSVAVWEQQERMSPPRAQYNTVVEGASKMEPRYKHSQPHTIWTDDTNAGATATVLAIMELPTLNRSSYARRYTRRYRTRQKSIRCFPEGQVVPQMQDLLLHMSTQVLYKARTHKYPQHKPCRHKVV